MNRARRRSSFIIHHSSFRRGSARPEFDHLEKWAGKTIVREALALLKGGMEIAVETHAGLTIRLVRHEIKARLLRSLARSRPAPAG